MHSWGEGRPGTGLQNGSFTGASPPHHPPKPALLTGHPTEVIYSDCQFRMFSPSDRGWSEINFGIFDLH